MKKLFLLITSVLIFTSLSSQNQGVAWIDTQKILETLPDYEQAKAQIESVKVRYEEIVDKEFKNIEILYNNYQAQKPYLNEIQRKKRESEIIEKERNAKEIQKTYLGQLGELAKFSDSLLSPIKNRVQGVIDQVANDFKIILIFDVSSERGIIYKNSKADLTNYIIEKLRN